MTIIMTTIIAAMIMFFFIIGMPMLASPARLATGRMMKIIGRVVAT